MHSMSVNCLTLNTHTNHAQKVCKEVFPHGLEDHWGPADTGKKKGEAGQNGRHRMGWGRADHQHWSREGQNGDVLGRIEGEGQIGSWKGTRSMAVAVAES